MNNAVTLGANGVSIGGTGTGTLGGVITDGASTFTLTKVGAGAITLGANNTYSGAVTVSAGTLVATNTGSLGDAVAANVITAGATLDLNFNGTASDTFTVSGTGVGGLGAILFSNGTGTTISGGITLGASSTFGGTGVGTISSVITDSGSTFNFTKAGTSTLTLSNSNTYSGITTVSRYLNCH